MKEWQFNVLFWVGVGGTVFLVFAPAVPAFDQIPKNPGAIGGIGTILMYVLTQKRSIVKKKNGDADEDKEGADA